MAPRGINDGPDRFHRGSRALRWLATRLEPPLWLHGHTTLVTRRLEDRCIQHGRTLFYNTVGAILVELVPLASSRAGAGSRRGGGRVRGLVIRWLIAGVVALALLVGTGPARLPAGASALAPAAR